MFLTMNRKKHKTKVVRYYLVYINVLNDFFGEINFKGTY